MRRVRKAEKDGAERKFQMRGTVLTQICKNVMQYENHKQFSRTGVVGTGGSGPGRRQGREAGVRSGRASEIEYHAQDFELHP